MATRVNAGDYVMTTSQAAKYLKLAEDTVRQYIRRNIIRATKAGPIYLVTKSECERYKRERRPRGNPTFSKTA